MNSFDEIALRLKQELKLTKDKELAQALGMERELGRAGRCETAFLKTSCTH